MMLLIFIHYKTSPEKSEKLLRINHLPCSGKGALIDGLDEEVHAQSGRSYHGYRL